MSAFADNAELKVFLIQRTRKLLYIKSDKLGNAQAGAKECLKNCAVASAGCGFDVRCVKKAPKLVNVKELDEVFFAVLRKLYLFRGNRRDVLLVKKCDKRS